MPPLTLLIKPASGSCNLRCKYCFYRDTCEKREESLLGMMTEETLTHTVKKAFSEAEGSVTFAFQGGEPTLAGLDFYRSFASLTKKYNVQKLKVNLSIQTNGTLIDGEFAKFLSENGFLVGLSLDGPREVHDLNRTDVHGDGTYSRVMKAAGLLRRHGVPFNILCVVTRRSARHPGEVYRFFKKNDFRHLQFIPCLDPLDEVRGGHPYSLTTEDYGYFMKTLFDLWWADAVSGDYVSIRQFENYVQILRGHHPESCGMSGRCGGYFVIESDGGVYPCDFYVLDRWKMGCVMRHSFGEMRDSAAASDFALGSMYLNEKCRACRYYRICRGGCRRDGAELAEGVGTVNYFCKSYADFFEYALPRLWEIARRF